MRRSLDVLIGSWRADARMLRDGGERGRSATLQRCADEAEACAAAEPVPTADRPDPLAVAKLLTQRLGYWTNLEGEALRFEALAETHPDQAADYRAAAALLRGELDFLLDLDRIRGRELQAAEAAA